MSPQDLRSRVQGDTVDEAVCSLQTLGTSACVRRQEEDCACAPPPPVLSRHAKLYIYIVELNWTESRQPLCQLNLNGNYTQITSVEAGLSPHSHASLNLKAPLKNVKFWPPLWSQDIAFELQTGSIY